MIRRSLRRLGTAFVLLVAFVCQETWALAGVTGGFTRHRSRCPILGSDREGRNHRHEPVAVRNGYDRCGGTLFRFLTLAPDTYTVTVSQERISDGERARAGRLRRHRSIGDDPHASSRCATIARVTSTGGSALVRSGTTADVYSINAAAAGVDRRRSAAAALDQSGLFGDFDRSGRVRHSEPNRLLRNDQYPRRRLRPSRLRVRRRSGQPLVR